MRTRLMATTLAILAPALALRGAAPQDEAAPRTEDSQRGATRADDTHWRLVWSDEFDAESSPDGLADPAKWSYETGFVRNREAQWYTKARKENARVEGGHLVIEARKEHFERAEYTSASLHTKGKGEWKHVLVEVRARLPTGRGMWPAIWMLGTNIREVGWPRCGELDIMENVGFDPDTIHANVHTRAYNHMKRNGKGSKLKVPRPHEDFHVYSMEWLEDRIHFYVDGRRYFTYENEGKGEASWPFDRPCYLIINAAVGGAWGGQKGIDDTIFPQKYLIDWVRVYERRKT